MQNFRAKRGTAMADASEPPLSELLWSVAAARLLLGPRVSVQAPPNLTPEPDDAAPARGDLQAGWRLLIDAGINDFGVGPRQRRRGLCPGLACLAGMHCGCSAC